MKKTKVFLTASGRVGFEFKRNLLNGKYAQCESLPLKELVMDEFPLFFFYFICFTSRTELHGNNKLFFLFQSAGKIVGSSVSLVAFCVISD